MALVDEKLDGLEAMGARVPARTVYRMDGISVEAPDWHFNVRAVEHRAAPAPEPRGDDAGHDGGEARRGAGIHSELTNGWRLAAGGWRSAAGDWRLAAGDWRLEAGDWRLAAGDWRRLEAGGGRLAALPGSARGSVEWVLDSAGSYECRAPRPETLVRLGRPATGGGAQQRPAPKPQPGLVGRLSAGASRQYEFCYNNAVAGS